MRALLWSNVLFPDLNPPFLHKSYPNMLFQVSRGVFGESFRTLDLIWHLAHLDPHRASAVGTVTSHKPQWSAPSRESLSQLVFMEQVRHFGIDGLASHLKRPGRSIKKKKNSTYVKLLRNSQEQEWTLSFRMTAEKRREATQKLLLLHLSSTLAGADNNWWKQFSHVSQATWLLCQSCQQGHIQVN